MSSPHVAGAAPLLNEAQGRKPDGTYRLTLRVLKPLADATNSGSWETATTVPFTIDRP